MKSSSQTIFSIQPNKYQIFFYLIFIGLIALAVLIVAILSISKIKNTGITNIIERDPSSTEGVDLSDVNQNSIYYTNKVQTGDILLPQATRSNKGMVIKILVGTESWSKTPIKLGFLDSGSTVMTGSLRLGINSRTPTFRELGYFTPYTPLQQQISVDTYKAVSSTVITRNTKCLLLSSDKQNAAGGASGSVYTFTYLEPNLVHVEAMGQTDASDSFVLPENAFSTTGILN